MAARSGERPSKSRRSFLGAYARVRDKESGSIPPPLGRNSPEHSPRTATETPHNSPPRIARLAASFRLLSAGGPAWRRLRIQRAKARGGSTPPSRTSNKSQHLPLILNLTHLFLPGLVVRENGRFVRV